MPGIKFKTLGSWIADIDTDQDFTIKGNSREVIEQGSKESIIAAGNSKEFVNGNKTSTVYGGKKDWISPYDWKFVGGSSTSAIIGDKNDLLAGARIEVHRGPHFKYGPTDTKFHSVRKKKVADEKSAVVKQAEQIGKIDQKIAEAKAEIGKDVTKVGERTEQIGKESVKIGDYTAQITNLKEKCDKLESTCGEIKQKSDGNFQMIAGGMMKMATEDLKMKVGGPARIRAGGPLDFQGALIKLG